MRDEVDPMTDEVSPSRVVSSARLGDDDQFEAGLRPRTLDAYIGQERLPTGTRPGG